MVQLATGTQDVRLSVDLICPHSGIVFTPEYVTSHTGHQVMAPTQTSPDGSGRKMSTQYGLLIGVVQDDEETPLARNSSSRFDVGRNVANKFWNASRFALLNISNPVESIGVDDLQPADHWMLQQVKDAIDKINNALKQYQFSSATEAIYDLLWRDFCDWYLEAIKPTVKENRAQQRVLLCVVDTICRLLHPICPFVTEAIWPHIQSLPHGEFEGIALASTKLVATSSWPDLTGLQLDADVVRSFEQVKELVTVIRAARAQQRVKPKQKIDLIAPDAIYELVSTHAVVLSSLAGLGNITKMDDTSAGLAVPFDCDNILLGNMLDEAQSKASSTRLMNEIEALEKKVVGFKNKLCNDSYINNAPPIMVQETRDMLVKAECELETARDALIL
jgi:valyl-tRNA synthetase